MARVTRPDWDPYDMIIELCGRVDELERTQLKIVSKLNSLDSNFEKMARNHARMGENNQQLVDYVTKNITPRK